MKRVISLVSMGLALSLTTIIAHAERLVLTAELTAKSFKLVTVPYTERSGWSKKILWMAPEGTVVKQGEPAVRFDPGSLLDEILRQEQSIETTQSSNLAAASRDAIEKADAQLKKRTAERNLEKARLQLSKITTFSSKKEVADAQFEVAKAISELKEADLALDNTNAKHRYGQLARAASLKKQQADLEKTSTFTELMEVVVPSDALIVYATSQNGADQRKVQEGDTLDTGSAVAKLFPLNEMQLRAYVNEVDSLRLPPSPTVEIVFDAKPKQTFTGKIDTVASYSMTLDKRGNGRWVEVVISLDGQSYEWMHAGMNARVEVQIDEG